jgi:prepilin-type N-terminal cleavage/methylation domain-containing protein
MHNTDGDPKKRNGIMRARRGFTLIEIMITVAIMGVVLSIAVPSGMKAAEKSRKTACMNNLRQVNIAKETWALMNNRQTGDPVVVDEINEFIKKPPTCPSGGTYTYGGVGINPTCSLGPTEGHVLPPE